MFSAFRDSPRGGVYTKSSPSNELLLERAHLSLIPQATVTLKDEPKKRKRRKRRVKKRRRREERTRRRGFTMRIRNTQRYFCYVLYDEYVEKAERSKSHGMIGACFNLSRGKSRRRTFVRKYSRELIYTLRTSHTSSRHFADVILPHALPAQWPKTQ